MVVVSHSNDKQGYFNWQYWQGQFIVYCANAAAEHSYPATISTFLTLFLLTIFDKGGLTGIPSYLSIIYISSICTFFLLCSLPPTFLPSHTSHTYTSLKKSVGWGNGAKTIVSHHKYSSVTEEVLLRKYITKNNSEKRKLLFNCYS